MRGGVEMAGFGGIGCIRLGSNGETRSLVLGLRTWLSDLD